MIGSEGHPTVRSRRHSAVGTVEDTIPCFSCVFHIYLYFSLTFKSPFKEPLAAYILADYEKSVKPENKKPTLSGGHCPSLTSLILSLGRSEAY